MCCEVEKLRALSAQKTNGPHFALSVFFQTDDAVGVAIAAGLVREVAILLTGAKFRSSYELYVHVIAAELVGLSDDKSTTIVAGQRPSDLTREEANRLRRRRPPSLATERCRGLAIATFDDDRFR